MKTANLTVWGRGSDFGLKVVGKIGEMGQFEELAADRGMIDVFALQCPGKVVGDEDGVQSGGEGGIDVGFRAVTDHPCGAGFAGVMRGKAAIGSMVLFGENFDGAEVRGKAGAAEFVGLLVMVSLGDQDEAMTGGKVGQSFGNVGQEFDLLIGDGLRKADDAIVFIGRDGAVGKLLEAGDERVTKTVKSVAASGDGGVFNVVETLADLLRAIDTVVEIGDEGCDGPLEVDIVLPQRVVCIDQQGLVGGVANGLGFAGHLARL